MRQTALGPSGGHDDSIWAPDIHATPYYLPQFWPFLLRQVTPALHRVAILDGNATSRNWPDL